MGREEKGDGSDPEMHAIMQMTDSPPNGFLVWKACRSFRQKLIISSRWRPQRGTGFRSPRPNLNYPARGPNIREVSLHAKVFPPKSRFSENKNIFTF